MPVGDLHDDDDVECSRLGQALTEPAPQVDDGDDDAAQIKHAADVFGLLGEVRNIRPAFDFTHRHDVDAVLVVANGEADKLD